MYNSDHKMTDNRTLRRSENAILAGVCAGLAEYADWPVGKVRLLWALGTVLTAGSLGIVAYVVLLFVMAPPGTGFQLENYRQQ